MIELILIGAAAWLLLKKQKPASGVGVPYQTYIRFDEQPVMPAPVAPAPVVEYETPIRDWEPEESEYLFRAADAYYRDTADYRHTDYESVIEAFMQGAETAEAESWDVLPVLEYKAQMDSAATDAAMLAPDFNDAYDAFVAGAEYVILREFREL